MELKDAIIKSRFYCAQQERCRFEVKQKLLNWGVNEQYFETILTELEKENFLSEKRFAAWFVKSKINQKKWGRLKIRNELMKRHLESHLIDEAISTANTNDIINNMVNITERKIREFDGKNDIKTQDKLKRFLYSKGYEPELIIEYLNKHKLL